MKLLIIEDEPRAANQLQKLLSESGLAYEVVMILDTIVDTLSWIKQNPPVDLIFMDVQLADGLSFEIFQHVEIQTPIIFTTAFDQYAIQAFKVNSIDYLLKPIKQNELEVALKKFQKSQSLYINKTVISSLLESMQKPVQRSGILVKEGSGYVQLRIDDLLYVYSEDSLTFAISQDKRYVINETIDQLISTLNKKQFFRINRGQVIAKTAIWKIEPYLNHRLKLQVLNSRDQEFVVSRQRTSEFKAWMNK